MEVVIIRLLNVILVYVISFCRENELQDHQIDINIMNMEVCTMYDNKRKY
jgi:hypothetical protein